MVTEEIKTLFRKANRQVDKKIWMGGRKGEDVKEAKSDERRRGGHIQKERERDKRAGTGERRGQRAPPSLSLRLKADVFKRLVHRLANPPAASAAECDGANVMRVVALPAYMPAATWSWRMHSLTPLGAHWPLSGHLLQGKQRFTHRKIERPKRLFQSEKLSSLVSAF